MGQHPSISLSDLDPLAFKEPCDHDIFKEELVTLPTSDIYKCIGKRNITSWIPKSELVKGVVFICHGLHEHSLVFDRLAHALTAVHIACFGIDHISHGLSDGQRGYIENSDVLVDDFVAFVSYIRKTHPAFELLPSFVFSHALGTLVSILAVPRIVDIAAVVFVSTALDDGYGSASLFGVKELFPLSSIAKNMSYISSAINPTGTVGKLLFYVIYLTINYVYLAPIFLSEITTDKNSLEKKANDGRRYSGAIMNKTSYECFRLTNAARLQIPMFKTPFLVIHGELDQISLVSGSNYLYEQSGTDENHKSILILKNCMHHPIHEAPQISKQCLRKISIYFESKLHH